MLSRTRLQSPHREPNMLHLQQQRPPQDGSHPQEKYGFFPDGPESLRAKIPVRILHQLRRSRCLFLQCIHSREPGRPFFFRMNLYHQVSFYASRPGVHPRFQYESVPAGPESGPWRLLSLPLPTLQYRRAFPVWNAGNRGRPRSPV